MTETPPHNPPARRHPRPQLYRTVLAIAVAALVAAWLPFSILYINALTNHAVAAAKVTHSLSAGTSSGQPGHSPPPIRTRVSGAVVP